MYDLASAYPSTFHYGIADAGRKVYTSLLRGLKLVAPPPLKLLDLGASLGFGLAILRAGGYDGIGIEGSPCGADVNPFLYQHDLRQPLPDFFKADIVTCIEVAEHIEPEFADQFVANCVAPSPRLIAVTTATPGQGGEHHVNEQPFSYWQPKFEKHGYRRRVDLEVRMTEVAGNPAHWYPKNLMVYTS